MNTFQKITALLFVIGFFTGSCKKEDSLSKTEILQSTPWKLESIKIGGVDLTSSLVSICFLDNSYTFLENGTCQIANNQIKCDPNEADITTVTWSLSSDDKTLTIDGTNYPVVRLNANEVVVNETLAGNLAENRYVPY